MDAKTYFQTIQSGRGVVSQKQLRDNQIKFNLSRNLKSRAELCRISDVEHLCVIYPNKNDKTVYHIEELPDDLPFHNGEYVHWAKKQWLITATFEDHTIQCKGEMTRCNQLLRFQTFDKSIKEYWCVVNDPLNARTSSYTSQIVNAVGTLQILLPYNEDTKQIYIDKRFILWSEYDKQGNIIPAVYKVIEIRHNTTDYGDKSIVFVTVSRDTYKQSDSLETMIADYIPVENADKIDTSNKYCLINSKPNIKLGNIPRVATAEFYSDKDIVANDIVAEWTVESDINELDYTIEDNSITLSLNTNDDKYIGEQIKITLTDTNNVYPPVVKYLEVI